LFPASADDALNCSLQMLHQLDAYNKTREKKGEQIIRVGIGLNTGISMLGIIGGLTRMEGTVISDAVNLASRLESLTKEYNVKLLISENTYYDLKDLENHNIRFIDRVIVKGKKQPQSVFEVFDNDSDEVKRNKINYKITFEEGVANYHYKNIQLAKVLFEQCIDKNPLDQPALKYLERCDIFLGTGKHKAATELSQQIEWTSDYNIGIKEIDDQHLELFNKSVKLLESVNAQKEDIEEIMSFLELYAQEHFETEERYMMEYEYPFIEHQKDQHKKFVKTFLELKKEVIDNQLAKTYLMFRIQIFVIDWIVNHTMKEDMHFGRFLKFIKKNG
jgi:hemerythrin-like metal-binding protein